MSRNVCPHCGSELLLFEEPSELRNEVQAYCDRCIASGPWELTEEEAIAAFCRPAHLVAEYDAKIAKLKEIIVEQAEAINKGAELCAECMYKEASDEQD